MSTGDAPPFAAGWRVGSGSVRAVAAGVAPRAATPRVGSTSVTWTTPTAYGGPGSRAVVGGVDAADVEGASGTASLARVDCRVVASSGSSRDHPHALTTT